MRSRQGVLHCVGCRLDVRLGGPGGDTASVVAAEDGNVGCCCIMITLPASARRKLTVSWTLCSTICWPAQSASGARSCMIDVAAPQAQQDPVPVSADASPQSTPGGAGDSDDGTQSGCSPVRNVSLHRFWNRLTQVDVMFGSNPGCGQKAFMTHLHRARWKMPQHVEEQNAVLLDCGRTEAWPC